MTASAHAPSADVRTIPAAATPSSARCAACQIASTAGLARSAQGSTAAYMNIERMHQSAESVCQVKGEHRLPATFVTEPLNGGPTADTMSTMIAFARVCHCSDRC